MAEQTHGVPEFHTWTVPTDGDVFLLQATSFYLQVSPGPTVADSTVMGVVRLYAKQQDFDDDENYIELDGTRGAFFGGPAELRQLWLRAIDEAMTVTVVGYQKKA